MRIFSLLLALVFVCEALGATSVVLRESAVVDGAVRLGDVAEVTGDERERLGEVVVFEESPGEGIVRLEDVRAALDEVGVNWGRVALRGGECVLRKGVVRMAAAVVSDGEGEAGFGVIDLEGEETARARVARVLCGVYGVENDDLRVRFDSGDAAFLDGIGSGAVYEVRVESTANAERAPVRVVVFDGERIAESRTVRADVRVRRGVVTLKMNVERGDRLGSEHLNAGTRWVAPGGSALVDGMGGAIGQLARTRLGAGTVLREAHLEKPVLIKRNELATVRCLNGSVSVRVRARAESDGREGDVIEFKKTKRGEAFRARVVGAGIAVAVSEEDGS